MALSEIAKMKMPYRAKIWVYVKRREALREKYNVKSAKFTKHSKTLNLKISHWRRIIKRIDEWELKLKEIDNVVIDYLGVSSKNTAHYYMDKSKWMAKHFVCRYAKEAGIPAKFIRAWIGLRGANAVGDARMRLIRRSAKDIDLRTKWKNFKLEMDNVLTANKVNN